MKSSFGLGFKRCETAAKDINSTQTGCKYALPSAGLVNSHTGLREQLM